MANDLKFSGVKAAIRRKNIALPIFCLTMCVLLITLALTMPTDLFVQSHARARAMGAATVCAWGVIIFGREFISIKGSSSYKYILKQAGKRHELHIDDVVFFEIDRDIKQGTRYGRIILGSKWIWIDFNAMALRRDNLRRHLIYEVKEHGIWCWHLDFVDNIGQRLRVGQFTRKQKSQAFEMHQLFCELFPDIPSTEEPKP